MVLNGSSLTEIDLRLAAHHLALTPLGYIHDKHSDWLHITWLLHHWATFMTNTQTGCASHGSYTTGLHSWQTLRLAAHHLALTPLGYIHDKHSDWLRITWLLHHWATFMTNTQTGCTSPGSYTTGLHSWQTLRLAAHHLALTPLGYIHDKQTYRL